MTMIHRSGGGAVKEIIATIQNKCCGEQQRQNAMVVENMADIASVGEAPEGNRIYCQDGHVMNIIAS